MTRFKDILLFSCVAILGVIFGMIISGVLIFSKEAKSSGRAAAVTQVSGDFGRQDLITTSYSSVVDIAAESVVYIFTTTRVREELPGFMVRRRGPAREREEEGLGSGVIMSREGYILTNHHVIEGADEIQVITSHTGESYRARVIGVDPQTDIAVLKISASGLPAISVAASDEVRVGDVALAIGNPFGVGLSVTMGIVGAVGRGGFGINDYEDFIQTDASINPGNSGGALVNTDGKLIGINTAILSRSGGNQGVGFSVPSNQAVHVMKRIIEDGRMIRGFLGVAVGTLTPNDAKRLNIPAAGGAVVEEIETNTPAARAGLRPGDVVVQIDGDKIYEDRHLRLLISRNRPSTKVILKIVRDGATRNVDVTLGEMPEIMAGEEEPIMPPAPTINPFDGVLVAELDGYARRTFRVPSRIFGALVVEISETSLAYKAGLRRGTVIMGMNDMPIRSAREAALASRFVEDPEVVLQVYRGRQVGYIRIQPE